MDKTNKVLVVRRFNTAGTSLAVGDLVVLDGERGTVVSSAAAASLRKIQFGVVKRLAVSGATQAQTLPAYIVKTKAFTRASITERVASTGTGSTEDSYSINFTGIKTATAANPLAVLVVNLTYRLEANNAKREESYVIRLADHATDAAVATRISNLINGNNESWSTASVTGATVTVSAMVAIDHLPGARTINSPFSYMQTKLNVSAYHKSSESLLSTIGQTGVAITQLTAANPGVNNPFVIRDMERKASGYDTSGFYHVYPNQAPMTGLRLNAAGEIDGTIRYNGVSFVFNNSYLAADGNYVKTSPSSVTILGEDPAFTTAPVMALLG